MSTIRKTHIPFLGTLFCLLFASVASAQTATAGKVLSWKLEQGQKFNMTITNDMDQQQNVGGQQMGSKIVMNVKVSVEVLGVNENGDFQLQQAIDDVVISATAQTPVGELTFDSESEEPAQGMAAMLAQQLKPMLNLEGVRLIQTVAPSGEKKEVTFAEGQEPPTGMMGEMSAENVHQMLSHATMKLPQDALAVGQEWEDEVQTEVPQMGKVNVTRKFRYQGPGEFNSQPAEVIAMSAETDFGDGEANAMGMKIDVKDQTVEGTVYFDAEAGYMLGSESTQKMTATIEAMGQTIEQVQTVKTSTKMSPA